MIAVEHVDDDPLPRLDTGPDLPDLRVGGVPEGSLPKGHIAGRHVEVPGEAAEAVDRRALERREVTAELHPPAVEDRDAVADVAQRDRQVDGVVGDLGRPAAARYPHDVVVDE